MTERMASGWMTVLEAGYREPAIFERRSLRKMVEATVPTWGRYHHEFLNSRKSRRWKELTSELKEMYKEGEYHFRSDPRRRDNAPSRYCDFVPRPRNLSAKDG